MSTALGHGQSTLQTAVPVDDVITIHPYVLIIIFLLEVATLPDLSTEEINPISTSSKLSRVSLNSDEYPFISQACLSLPTVD